MGDAAAVEGDRPRRGARGGTGRVAEAWSWTVAPIEADVIVAWLLSWMSVETLGVSLTTWNGSHGPLAAG
jgi:hypothetical protein